MTCQAPINPDRSQLMAIAAADAATPSPRSALALHMDSTAPASGPAATTETPLSNGARAAMIAARCKTLRHANNVQRKRFLAVHKALATYLAGRDA